jgi:hypothetical protein
LLSPGLAKLTAGAPSSIKVTISQIGRDYLTLGDRRGRRARYRRC